MEIFTSQVHEEIDSRTVYVELLLNNFKSSFTKLLDFRSKITSKVWSGNRTELATNSVGNFKPEIKYLGGYFSEYYSPFGQFTCIFFLTYGNQGSCMRPLQRCGYVILLRTINSVNRNIRKQ